MDKLKLNGIRHSFTAARRGFTLLELSIVLTIIGLVVGGIFVGAHLIESAGERGQISQIQRYSAAANTFLLKYNYLPGDLPATPAAKFGFISRGTTGGTGDGNGVIQGTFFGYYGGVYGCGSCQTTGETAVFWVDLSTAHLIEGGFTTADNGNQYGGAVQPPYLYFPSAKIGNGNYVYVWSGGAVTCCATWTTNGKNYFGISAVTGSSYTLAANPGLTVKQAEEIDTKMDDGLPQSGKVLALYIDQGTFGFPAFGWVSSGVAGATPYTTATFGSATSCFDNRGVVGPMMYSVNQNYGSNVNCALTLGM